MWRPFGCGLILVLGAFGPACESAEDRARNEPLLPAETFHWSAQPLSFQPPPADWARQKHNQGGLLGIWFTHAQSGGERIYVSEYGKVARQAEHGSRRLPLTLDEVVDQTRFSTEGWPVHPDSFLVAEMLPDSVAGVPAYRLDFELHMPERVLVGREYYFLESNHLFEAAFLGLSENLPLFERVVESITLPPGEERP